jgi:hypothetical protein
MHDNILEGKPVSTVRILECACLTTLGSLCTFVSKEFNKMLHLQYLQEIDSIEFNCVEPVNRILTTYIYYFGLYL